MHRWFFSYRSALVVLTALVLTGCPVPAPDPQPEANFNAVPRFGNTGLKVSFSDMSTAITEGGVVSWQWNFGDGSRSQEPNPTHTFLTPGEFTVSLTVTSSAGTHTRTRPGYIRIDSPSGSAQLDNDGGTVSANGVVISIPEGALQSRVDFGVTRTTTEIPLNVFETINLVGDTFRVTHNSTTSLSTTSSENPFQPAQLSIPYAEDVVPTGSRIPAKVHILAQLSSGEVFPILGRIRPGRVEADVSDLPTSALYTVVYRPEAYLATAVDTAKAPTSTQWNSSWQVSLSPALLNQLTALRLGSVQQASSFFAAEFSASQLEATEQALLDGILVTQQSLESAGARSPRLTSLSGAYTVLCYNLVQQYPTAVGSLANVTYADSPFGGIVLDPRQLLAISAWNADRIRANPTNQDIAQKLSAQRAFGEVLARAVVSGYDYPTIASTSPADGTSIDFSAGIREGLALYIGQMGGGLSVNRSQLAGDKALLSTPVLAPFDVNVPSYAAASQDFFRYVANQYSPDPALGYVVSNSGATKGLLEEVRLALDGSGNLTFADAAVLSSMAIDRAFVEYLEVSLGAAYHNYVVDLAFEHGESGVLRPSDSDRLPLVLDASRFAANGIVEGELAGESANLNFPVFGEVSPLTSIPPLSSRVVVLSVDPLSTNLSLTFNRDSWISDEQGQGIEIIVYREGLEGVRLPAGDTELLFSDYEADLGEESALFYVLVMNTNVSAPNTVTLAAVTTTPSE